MSSYMFTILLIRSGKLHFATNLGYLYQQLVLTNTGILCPPKKLITVIPILLKV